MAKKNPLIKNSEGVVLRAFVARLKAAEHRLAKERDALRDLARNIEAQDESAERAIESLHECIDALSEYV